MEHRVDFHSVELLQKFCGVYNKNIRALEKTLDVKIKIRGNAVLVEGENVKRKEAVKIINDIRDELVSYKHISSDAFKEIVERQSAIVSKKRVLYIPSSGKTIIPKTKNQERLINAIIKNDLVIITGPAGTGKTFLAVATAVYLLERGVVSRIVLTRPAVEAGESLGYLPGDLYQKIEPYLKPLYDALYYIFGIDKVLRYIEKGIIEVIPLAYMRGRTLNDAFIILDEAQNTTTMQMKMFLTRLGEGSKMVITGDITQIDLKGQKSGIVDAIEVLSSIEGVVVMGFEKSDIVRHNLVQKIVEAYEKRNKKEI
jgi:phosphate starvation-inducible PhoH-like protein